MTGAAPWPPTHEPALVLAYPSLWRPPARLRPRVQCTAHRSDGAPCRAWAMHGQRVCWSHGGASPQARMAAQRRLEMAALSAFIYRIGPPPPLGAARHVAWVNSVLGRGR